MSPVANLKVFRVQDIDVARAIPFSFLFGAVVPAVIGMQSTWNGSEQRSAEAHQKILAAWQPDPIWVSIIQMGIVGVISSFRGRTSRDGEKRAAYKWIRISYLAAAVSSALGHLYVMGRVLAHDSPAQSLIRMYMPFPFHGPSGTSDILVRGPWLFLQYDLIIISISSLSWAFILVSRACKGKGLSKSALALVMLVGFLTIGPGATISLALFAREGILPIYTKELERFEEKS